jgi:hypothetical protein
MTDAGNAGKQLDKPAELPMRRGAAGVEFETGLRLRKQVLIFISICGIIITPDYNVVAALIAIVVDWEG